MSHLGSIVVYDDFDQPGGFCWEPEQVQRLSVNIPQFLSEAGVCNALFDFAITRCGSGMLKFLIRISGGDLQLGCLGTSGFTPLPNMVLSLNVVSPVKDSEDDDLDDISIRLPIWCSKVKEFYTLLKQLQISQDIADKDGKTGLCHALDRLYSEALRQFFSSISERMPLLVSQPGHYSEKATPQCASSRGARRAGVLTPHEVHSNQVSKVHQSTSGCLVPIAGPESLPRDTTYAVPVADCLHRMLHKASRGMPQSFMKY